MRQCQSCVDEYGKNSDYCLACTGLPDPGVQEFILIASIIFLLF